MNLTQTQTEREKMKLLDKDIKELDYAYKISLASQDNPDHEVPVSIKGYGKIIVSFSPVFKEIVIWDDKSDIDIDPFHLDKKGFIMMIKYLEQKY